MDAMRPSGRLQTLLVLCGVVFVSGSVLVVPDPNERITYTTNLRPVPVESLVSAESRVPDIPSISESSGDSLKASESIVPGIPPSPGPLLSGTQGQVAPEPNTGTEVDISGLIRDKRHGGWGGYGGGYGGGYPVAVIAIGGGGGYGHRRHRHHGGWGGGGYGGYPGGGYGGYPGGGYGGGYGGSWSQSSSQSSSGSFGGGWGR